MNREILFRGKRVDNGEWVYGDLIQLHDGRKYIIDNKFGACLDDKGNFINTESPFVNEVIPETVSQYTGLEDKNGNKIFEGDIVMYDYEWTKPNEIGVITWNESNASFQIKGHIPSSSMKHLSRMKVIGNIFDEKE